MKRYLRQFRESARKSDWVLLLLCLVCTAFGCLVVASTTNVQGSLQPVITQIGATAIGIVFYVIFSAIDADFFSEHRMGLVAFNTLLLLLLIPLGVTVNGNRSWIQLPLIPFRIQVAEICKIPFILIMASVMNARQNNISRPRSVFHMVWHLGVLAGVNLILSKDMGVSLIFVAIFAGMAFSGGVSLLWFLGIGGLIAVAAPILYNYFLSEYQQLRIEVLFNPDLDPLGTGPRYHTVQSLRSLTGGGMTGQGLFHGHRTQTEGALFAQRTDYIFSAIGEELGYIGCVIVLVLLFLIVARCIWVGMRSKDYMRRLICFGAASALSFQIISNVGMCIGLTPVIGLTLPFFSYGGSSIVSLYAMLGLVSGVFARPKSTSHERYIRPPMNTL